MKKVKVEKEMAEVRQRENEKDKVTGEMARTITQSTQDGQLGSPASPDGRRSARVGSKNQD